MAFINVIIPVFNAVDYLDEAVESILSQSSDDINIYLIDDGSSDGSSELCNVWKEKSTRIFVIHKNNGGVSSARNTGLKCVLDKNSEGYIAFLDADDVWGQDAITDTLCNRIKKSKADIVSFSYYYGNETLSRFNIGVCNKKEIYRHKQYKVQDLYPIGHIGSNIYNINLFKENDIFFDENCKHNEDVIWSAKVRFCSRCICSFSNFLYKYRNNAKSATSIYKYTMDNAKEIPDAWLEAIRFTDGLSNISNMDIMRWKDFCLNTSAVRCLEILKILILQGNRWDLVEEKFRNEEYFNRILSLDINDVAEWQHDDLIMFKSNRIKFYKIMKTLSYKYIITLLIKKLILKIPFVKIIIESKRYPLRKVEINR